MKIAVLLSGGVDSSVALSLLKQHSDHSLKAFYLKIWLEEELSFLGDCPWEDDLKYARAVCQQLKVPLEIISFQENYQNLIVDKTIRELKLGRTPSPDILCNQQIKFGAFLDAINPSFDKVASGHYAQTEIKENEVWLKQAPDPIKDQTYFLSALRQEQLKKIVFPIGHLQKREVRALAEKFRLPNKLRKDSQGICFLGKIKYNDFVRHHLGEQVGDIIDIETNKKLGEHRGFWFHTIGQRKGLSLSGGPWYIAKKDVNKNVIYVYHGKISINESVKKLIAGPINWIAKQIDDSIKSKTKHITVLTKLRHGPNKLKAHVTLKKDKMVEVNLEQEDQGVAPGQSIVFYQGSRCLGGGVIQNTW